MGPSRVFVFWILVINFDIKIEKVLRPFRTSAVEGTSSQMMSRVYPDIHAHYVELVMYVFLLILIANCGNLETWCQKCQDMDNIKIEALS